MKVSKQVVLQGLRQSFGIPYIYASHRFRLPNNNYRGKIKYRLPFEGEWVVVNGGVTEEFSHSWSVPTQRYAYDFLMMNGEGKTYCGDEKDIRSYYCYDKNVLAPADGTVVEIGNSCEDGRIMTPGDMEATANDIRGNYIIIKHADGEYGFLGHLKPESITVKVGQSVCCGEIIAKCGNTGNSSEPHVHFHVQDGINFFTSAGVPISFENIKVSRQKNFHLYDDRKISDAYTISETTVRIGRGQMVENNP